MNQQEHRPCLRVRITLTRYWQEKLAKILGNVLNIYETHPVEHTVYMDRNKFVEFLLAVKDAGIDYSADLMHAALVDLKKEPVITVVKTGSMNYERLDRGCDGC